MTKDVSENAKFEIRNVSSDKRSLREDKKFYLSELDVEG